MSVELIAIDLAKNVYQLCGVNRAGKSVFNKQVSRTKFVQTIAQYPGVTVAMEACCNSNYIGRLLLRMGYNVNIIPPNHVKPFVKGNKNDRNDAFAIAEAARRPDMHFVQPRSIEQTDMSIAHKIRERRIAERTALVNQVRGLLMEYGVTVPLGIHKLRADLPLILGDAENELSIIARQQFQLLLEEWQALDILISEQDTLIKRQAHADKKATRLMQIKGIAELTSTAIVSHMGASHNYKNGRHYASCLGVVPQEYSSGGKQKVGGITKRGNKYIRRLLVQCAWSIIRRIESATDNLSLWAKKVIERRGKQIASLAIANKLARIVWAMSHYKQDFNYGN